MVDPKQRKTPGDTSESHEEDPPANGSIVSMSVL